MKMIALLQISIIQYEGYKVNFIKYKYNVNFASIGKDPTKLNIYRRNFGIFTIF